ncbi:porin family protein [Ideonella sp.]|uniref:porin family protein n=1 Tax=Ideonella sp. TaxID=1929293 RepID=UPI0035B3AFC6
MKKTASILALVATLFTTGAMAQGYVSADAGVSSVDLECDGAATCDDSGTTFRLTGGYGFYDNLSAELAYVDYGKAKAADPGVSLSMRVSGFQLGLAYRLPLADAWGLNFRAGIASLKTKADATFEGLSGSTSETNTQPYFGIGADFALSKTLKLQAGYEMTKAELEGEKTDLSALTVGLRFDF